MSALLQEECSKSGAALFSAEFAAHMDAADPLASFRSEFLFPDAPSGCGREKAIYLCGRLDFHSIFLQSNILVHYTGNSLGLQPKNLKTSITNQLDKWAAQGVEGHFEQPTPWLTVSDCTLPSMHNLTAGA